MAFVLLHFFPVELSPSPPLKSSTSQGFRADFFAVHSGHVTRPAECSFPDGRHAVHVAFLDPSVTRPVVMSPPLVHFHPWWLLHASHVCHHSRTPARNFVSLCLDRLPDTRTPEKSLSQ